MAFDLPAYDTVSVDDDAGGVAVLWLDRPEKGNAFTPAMQAELHDAMAALDARDEVRAIVVTGRGRLFSAGADVGAGGSTFAQSEEVTAAMRGAMAERPRPWDLATPVIGALNGSAVGLGLTLPLQWDVRFVADGAKYGFVFPRRGITPEAGSTWLLPRLIGQARAMELLLTGRFFDGEEAVRIGLATASAPPEQVLPTALAFAHGLADSCAPTSLAMIKHLVHRQAVDVEDAWSYDWELFRWIGRGPDAAEGVSSFLEKRPPVWSGDKHATPPAALPAPWTTR